jgi:molecular chaperone HtpG
MSEHAFVAEVSEVLNLVIHSLYSHREIFLRELVSNASDALDKRRFLSLTSPELAAETLEIKVSVDKAARTVTIEDSGIGMTEEELVKNLGTVAHSGTKELLRKLGEQKSTDKPSLIGQFGVGFYSAYLVADRVEVFTRSAQPGSKGYLWASTLSGDTRGDGRGATFTVTEEAKDTAGTRIVLHLKKDADEFLESWKLQDLVERYSDFVAHPIVIGHPQQTGEDDQDPKAQGIDWRRANRGTALWQRPKAEITEDKLKDLYQHIAHDFEAPLSHLHFKVEGTLELSGILFLPRKPPFDLFETGKRRGVRLFVRHVFITDDAEELIPTWLRFVRGVVDSEDLPLNVSRETLQDSSIVRAIRKQVTKKSLEMIETLAAERKDEYLAFWQSFGPVLKEGVATDQEYRDRLASLCRYRTTANDALTSFAEYKERAKEGQKEIYYLYGSEKTAVASSPYVEALVAKGYEVLLMQDPVDEWAAEALGDVLGMKLTSVLKADLAQSEEEKKTKEADTSRLAPLLSRMQQVLGDKVKEVRVSSRLATAPACLALDAGQIPAYMEALLRANGRKVPDSKRIFEVNPNHALMTKLMAKLETDAATTETAEGAKNGALVDDAIALLFDQARILEGSSIEDPQKFGERLASVLQASLGA